MIVTFLRSSSVGSYGWCPHKFFLTSNLGHKEPSGKKAESGNIVHKALELLARKKLAHQNKEKTFSDPEVAMEFDTATFTPELAIEAGWNHYTNPERSVHPWTKGDRKKCEQWTWDVLLFNDGMFSPVNRQVVMPEEYFEIEIKEPWAQYDYTLPDGRTYQGNLILRGTMDLVTRIRPGLIEYIDWKTGKRRDWAKDKVKEYDDMYSDFQLRLYHYALCHLYPKDEILMTIFFVQDGGPFSLCMQRSDLPETLDMIRKEFEKIKDDQFPSRILDRDPNNWKCSRLCSFYKDEHPETGLSTCNHYRNEILQLGLDKVVAKYAKGEPWAGYGSGGGRTEKVDEPNSQPI